MKQDNSYRKHLTIEEELKWYEHKVNQLRESIDSVDLMDLKDRTGLKESSRGGAYPVVVSTIEQIKASWRQEMKDLYKLLDILDTLRNKYAEKEFMARGKVEIKNTGLDFAKKFAKENPIDEED